MTTTDIYPLTWAVLVTVAVLIVAMIWLFAVSEKEQRAHSAWMIRNVEDRERTAARIGNMRDVSIAEIGRPTRHHR